jgi:hypothetical protein
VVWVVIAVAVTALFTWGRAREARSLNALETGGKTVTGRVTDVTSQPTSFRRGSSLTYFVHYEFNAGGTRVGSNDEVSV